MCNYCSPVHFAFKDGVENFLIGLYRLLKMLQKFQDAAKVGRDDRKNGKPVLRTILVEELRPAVHLRVGVQAAIDARIDNLKYIRLAGQHSVCQFDSNHVSNRFCLSF